MKIDESDDGDHHKWHFSFHARSAYLLQFICLSRAINCWIFNWLNYLEVFDYARCPNFARSHENVVRNELVFLLNFEQGVIFYSFRPLSKVINHLLNDNKLFCEQRATSSKYSSHENEIFYSSLCWKRWHQSFTSESWYMFRAVFVLASLINNFNYSFECNATKFQAIHD